MTARVEENEVRIPLLPTPGEKWGTLRVFPDEKWAPASRCKRINPAVIPLEIDTWTRLPLWRAGYLRLALECPHGVPAVTFAFSGAKQKPALDEDSFEQLLAAAYTLQEHKDALRAKSARHDPAGILSEIASMRSKVLADGQNFASAAVLVVDCLRKLTGADGASVCRLRDGYLKSIACSGTAAKAPGGSVASNSLVATERLRNGLAFQSANARSDIRLEPALSIAVELGSLLAAPIDRNNEIAGLVELRWKKAEAFEEWDERICQLLVSLLGEVLNRESGSLKAEAPPAKAAPPAKTVTAPDSGSAENLSPTAPKVVQPLLDVSRLLPAAPVSRVEVDTGSMTCRVCGRPLPANNDFCGNCGMLAAPSDDGMQSKWASMWFMQKAQKGVETGQDRGVRFWPLDGANARLDVSSPSTKGSGEEIQETNESGGEVADDKRNPRSVLSVLKSRFKVRAMGR
jgi:hypothetical protein